MSMILPGSTIGIIGGGQLARMMILEGRKMGYHFVIVDPAQDCASHDIANDQIVASWSSLNAALQLAKVCDVITVDTEHVAWQSIQAIEDQVPAYPSSIVLKNVQDRLSQRDFLQKLDIAQTPYVNVESIDELRNAIDQVGLPCVLKTRTSGYDGKGQAVIKDKDDIHVAWDKIGRVPAIVEGFVDFQDEVSVLVARTRVNSQVRIATYPLAKNIHRKHILHKTVVPAGYPENIEKNCFQFAHKIVDAFDYIGIMAIEMFVTKQGEVLVNEIAPRTHNSGHFTYGGCVTSQFEQQIRAITGQSLGATTLIEPVVMVNLLGDLWKEDINFQTLMQTPGVTLHLYDKHPAKPGRKMGHFLVQGQDIEALSAKADDLYNQLT
ncbi:MAG: 5-(carboxyamino)imidazole ribonucleotide synthase [Bdellovibrionales bacterium]|nr:5-(carboxyamino)imidazole ribonucleotide synthase [Bdellovibrionales bacterium]